MSKQEIKLSEKAFLVSETDAKGIIKFANDDYCHYSGFTLDELIGSPHNIVRHPDMPKEAFTDLWKTIMSGKKWRGFIKNKAKDGRFYWVYATVYPFTSCDGSQGYISCRGKASDAEIEEYTELYIEMKKGTR